MATYYVNKNAQANGDHEVHKSGCSFMPDASNRIALGDHSGCRSAVAAAKRHYTRVNGCYYCARPCHTS
jgi:hypothetical protein